MRPRPLQEDSAVIRSTGFADLSVTAGTVFKTAAQAPAAYGLLKQSWQTAGSVFENLTEEEREAAREQQRQRDLRQTSLQDQLDYETDPAKREALLSEIDQLYKAQDTQRETQTQTMIEDGRLLSVDALTEEFGDLLEFDSPMARDKAELLYKNKQESRVRDAIISKGLDGVPGYAALIGGSLVAAAVDPIELGAAFIPVVGVAGRAAAAARFGRIGGAAAVGTAEGFTGALLTEPLYYALSNQQQLDYSMGEALLNVGIGTLLGSGIGTVRGIYDIRKPNIKEITQDVETVTDVLPEPLVLTREETAKLAARNRLNSVRNYDILGGSPVAQTVLRQFANDQSIDVSPVIPRFVKKPTDLVEFVKEKGGIKTNIENLSKEIKSLKISNIKTARKTSDSLSNFGALNADGRSIRNMVRTAYNAGYLESRDTKEFFSKLQENTSGRYVFARDDENKAMEWRSYYKADNDIVSEQAHKSAIVEQVKGLTGKTLSEEEVSIISRSMSKNNLSLEEAASDVQLRLYDFQAEKLAQYGVNPRADIASDVDIAQRFSEEKATIEDEFNFDAELQQSDAIIRQYQEAGDLTDDDIKAIAELQQVEETMDAYIELVQTAAICTARA